MEWESHKGRARSSEIKMKISGSITADSVLVICWCIAAASKLNDLKPIPAFSELEEYSEISRNSHEIPLSRHHEMFKPNLVEKGKQDPPKGTIPLKAKN